MTDFFKSLETYLMVLVHPFRIHQQFRFHIPLPNHDSYTYEPLSLAESISLSWVFSVIRGLGKIIILNYFLHTFWQFQSDEFPIIQELIEGPGLSAYYFLVFSSALDIVFFPIIAFVSSELWAWIIRQYANWLNPALPKEEIADQITTHALSSNLFSMIPVLGDIVQNALYYFLIYAGLRTNLGASRSLAFVILLTPFIAILMTISLFFLILFYLMS
jgi:hypothetical protein